MKLNTFWIAIVLFVNGAFAKDNTKANCPPKPCKPCPPVCFERGYPDTQCCLPSAYNEPANFELSPCPWNVWIDTSFTYWIAYEEGLDLALNQSFVAATTQRPTNATFEFQDTEFKPGFKVGLGMNFGHDHWSGFAEYTWFRSRTKTSLSPLSPDDLGRAQLWTIVWTGTSSFSGATSLTSVWRLRMDLLDAGLMRPYYQGTHLIVSPFGGLRAQWIRQNLRIEEVPNSGGVAQATPPVAVLHNKSNSWAIGPRGGIQGKWHWKWGFRLEGDFAMAILFTRYPKVSSAQDTTRTIDTFSTKAKYTNYDTLRVDNDANLGIGWGHYFDCRRYHLDLLLSYDFQVFWNQNMMRLLVDNSAGTRNSAAMANLYLQGLTVRGQFDF